MRKDLKENSRLQYSRRFREFRNSARWYREYPFGVNFADPFHVQTATLQTEESW